LPVPAQRRGGVHQRVQRRKAHHGARPQPSVVKL
jgi:hypothetical protein